MISSISLQNFKLFREKKVFDGLTLINILTGVNGRGKSTLLQSLLLPKQTLDENEWSRSISLNGGFVKLGNGIDVKNEKSSRSSKIEFGYCINGQQLLLSMSVAEDNSQKLDVDSVSIDDKIFDCHSKGAQLLNLVPQVDNDDYVNLSTQLSSVRYISAERIGPRLKYEPMIDKNKMDALGKNCAYVLYSHKDDPINSDSIDGIYNIFPGESELDDLSFNGLVEFWMGKMFGKTKLHTEYLSSANIYVLGYTTMGRKDESKPTNVGYGYSCVLPIIVAGLMSQKDDVFIVENPEAHLHPQAQSMLGKFLAWLAKYSGVQVFVETHSEHIVNSFRVLVAQDIVPNDNVNILFFDQSYEDWAHKITIEPKGEILSWPTRFFDQEEKDLDIIVK
jgi:predicted ATPase